MGAEQLDFIGELVAVAGHLVVPVVGFCSHGRPISVQLLMHNLRFKIALSPRSPSLVHVVAEAVRGVSKG